MAKGTSMVGIGSVEELSHIARMFPQASFELSYNRRRDELEEWLTSAKGRIASIHALSPMRSFFPNFARMSYVGPMSRCLRMHGLQRGLVPA